MHIALHPLFHIMASVGEDMNLMIWNIETNKLLKKMHLGRIPTALKFSSTGDYLAIGYINGLLTIFGFFIFFLYNIIN